MYNPQPVMGHVFIQQLGNLLNLHWQAIAELAELPACGKLLDRFQPHCCTFVLYRVT